MADLTYTKTNWVDKQTPVSAANLNNIEAGVANAITAFNNIALTPGAPGADGKRGAIILVASIDVQSGGKIPTASLVVPTGATAAVNDVVFDTNGDTYYVKAVASDGITMGDALPINIKGPKGEQGTPGKAGTPGADGTDGTNGKSVAGFEFTFTKDAAGAITAATAKYKLDGETTAAHDAPCTIKTATA